MKIAMIGGTGYVGLVTGVGFASRGHDVVCMDIDERKIDGLHHGVIPIYEEGLDKLLQEAWNNKRISFTTELNKAVVESDVIFVTVGTPEGKNGKTNRSYLMSALKSIAQAIDSYKVVVIKSTVPVGTGHMAGNLFKKYVKDPSVTYDIVSNPEFLREGTAVQDFLYPERVIIGAESEKASVIMQELYKSFDAPIIVTDIKSSEMIKYACNAYLATRISFVNEIAEICQKVDADVSMVLAGMKYDKRIGGLYLNPGPGFGGPCLSKDIKSLIHIGKKAKANVSLLKSVLKRNEVQIKNILNTIQCELMGIEVKKVAVLGLSFKAGTNDIRNSPAVHLIDKLLDSGYHVSAYDPVVRNYEPDSKGSIIFTQSARETIQEADCVIIMTEWNEFKELDVQDMNKLMRTPLVIDTRNILSAKLAHEAGLHYIGIGTRIQNVQKGNRSRTLSFRLSGFSAKNVTTQNS